MSNQNIDLRTLSINDLQQTKRNQEIRLAQLKAANEARQKQISAPAGAAQYLKYLTGGDALSINNVIWPFAYVVSPLNQVVNSNGGRGEGSFQVSQEAAFIWTSMRKVVYEVDFNLDPITLEYINPSDVGGISDANGLKFSLSDGSSSRTFMEEMIPLDNIGNPEWPFMKDRPMLLQPQQRIQVDFSNENPNRSFVPFLIFTGYRMRVEAQNDLLNLQG